MAKPARPALVTVLSVFNILIGVLTIFCSGCSGAMIAWLFSVIRSVPVTQGEPHPKEMFDIANRHFPNYEEIMVAGFVVIAVIGLFMIISGIGTLMLAQWGRWLTILTGLAIIATALALAGYYIGVVIPNMPKMQKELIDYQKKIFEDAEKKRIEAEKKRAAPGSPPPPTSPPPPAFATPTTADQSANHVFYLACLFAAILYGSGMIILMLLPGTRAAFSAIPTPDERDDDDRDRHRFERRRRLLDDDDFDRPRRRYEDDDFGR